MASIEEFRQQLEEAITIVDEKKRIVQEAAVLSQQKKEREQAGGLEGEGIERAKKDNEARTREERVLNFDSRFPLRQYLELLGEKMTQNPRPNSKEKILPSQRIRRWSNGGGEIAYSLWFSRVNSYIKVAGPMHGMAASNRDGVLGISLNYRGEAIIRNRKIAKSPYFEKSPNPLTWDPKFDFEMLQKGLGKSVINTALGQMIVSETEEISHLLGMVDLKSEEAMDQIGETLIAFYQDFMTGSISPRFKTGKTGHYPPIDPLPLG